MWRFVFQPGLSRLSLNTNKRARSTRFDTYRRSGSSFPWNQFLCQSQELIFNCHCQNLYQILCVSIGGRPFASLHMAHLTFYAGQEDAALAHLKEHLSWRVQRGRDTCAGCWQTRGEDTPMLTCSGCRVARFCSADHQKIASKKAALGGSLTTGRHKDICGVLSKWREVVKDGVSPDLCTADLVAFLQR